MTAERAHRLRLLADENIQRSLVHELRRYALDVAYVAEGTSGITDQEVLRLAVAEQRLLLTEDKDFGELVFRLKLKVPGLILVRVNSFDPAVRSTRLRALIERYGDDLYSRYVVVTPEQFRLRKLPDSTS